MKARPVVAIGAALLLSACAAGQKERAPANSTAAIPPDAAADSEAAPKSGDVQKSVRTTPAPEPPPDPETLLGLTAQALDKLLGEPDLVRRDGPAEIRLYRDAERTCTFHVFLYASAPTAQDHAVEHFEARNAQGRLADTDVARCYRAVLRPAVTS